MANPSVVQVLTTTTTSQTNTKTVTGSGVGAGNPLVLWFGDFGLNIVSVVGGGATWTKLQAGTSSSTYRGELWIGTGGTGGSISVVITVTAGNDTLLPTIYEVANYTSVESSSMNNASSNTAPSVSATPASSGALVFGFTNSGGGSFSSSPSSPWVDTNGTLDSTLVFAPSAYQLNCASGVAKTATWATGGSGTGTVAALVIAGAGGGAVAPPPSLTVRRRRLWVPLRRAFTARPFPAPPVVTAQPLPVQMPRDPLRGWFFRPRRFSSTVPAANAPHLPPVQMPRDPMRGFFFRRHGFTASPVTVQVNAQPGPLVAVHLHRSQPWPLRHRTYTAEPPPTVTVTVPQQPAHRQRTPFRARARQASPPLSIAITSTQNLPPQPPRDQRIGWLPRRRPFEARVPLLGQAPLVTVEVQQPRRRTTPWPRQRRAWRTDVVISQTPAPTTQALPPQQPRAPRMGWLPRRRSFTARVPLTGRAPNLTVLVQQPHRRTLLPPLLRRGHAASPPPIVLAFTPPQPARRARPFPFRARARAAEPFTVTISVPPVQETPRRRPLIPRRARTASPPFAPAKTHQALPPQPATGKRHIWPILRRAKATQFIAGGQAPVGPPYPVNPGGNTGPLPGIYDSGATPVMPVNPG